MMLRSRLVRRFVGGLIAIAVLGVAAFWVVSGQLIAPVNCVVGAPPADFPAEAVAIEGESASPVAGWHAVVPGSTATILLLHPLHGDRRSMLGRARLLREAGYDTLLIDLPGHGETQSETLSFGWRSRLAVTDAVRFLRRRSPGHRIGVVGWSLGGASAVLASPLGVDALVLESVYPAFDRAVRNRVALRLGEPAASIMTPLLTAQLPLRLGELADKLRPLDRIGDVGCPVFVAAGDADRRTSRAETEELVNQASQPKELLWFYGAGHEDLLRFDRRRWESRVLGFLNPLLRSERQDR